MGPNEPQFSLPEGWIFPDANQAELLLIELQKELPPGHLLENSPVRAFAWRDGMNDDVLFQHLGDPARFTVIHLSWISRTEIDAQYPTVEFDGIFADFLADEEWKYGYLDLLEEAPQN